jgi:hypothetical protein
MARLKPAPILWARPMVGHVSGIGFPPLSERMPACAALQNFSARGTIAPSAAVWLMAGVSVFSAVH